MRHEDQPYASVLQSPGWLIAEPLDPAIAVQVADFNVRGLRLQLTALSAAVAAPPPGVGKTAPLPRALSELASLWLALDAAALRRLAQLPYLLFELGLDTPQLFAQTQIASRVAAPNEASPVPASPAHDFARIVLHYAWHLARANPLGAALGLGMPQLSAAALRELSFGDLEWLAPQAAARLRMRWAQRPAVWRGMLSAASGADTAALQREQLSGLRRLAGDLLAAASTGAAPARASLRAEHPLW
jgi:hypothetical protein